MWRRIQAGLGRIRDSFHRPVQHFADATPLSKAPNKPGSTNKRERPGRRLISQANRPAPGSAAFDRVAVNKRRRNSSRSALHQDYVLKLERLVFGLDQIEDDESLSNAIDGRIENALDDAKCEDHGVYESRVEELADEKWKVEERIQKGFVKLSATAIAVHNSLHTEREEFSNSVLPWDFREALEDWSMKREVCQERQYMFSRKENLRDVGQRLLQAKTAQIKKRGWRPTSSYLGQLHKSRNKLLRLTAVSKVARRNARNTLRRLCKVHARKALFDISSEDQQPPTDHQKAACVVPDVPIVSDVVQAPDLEERWTSIKNDCQIGTEWLREVFESHSARDQAVEDAVYQKMEAFDADTFEREWFAEVSKRARRWRNVGEKFVPIRDEAMRAGFSPVAIGDEAWGEFEKHRDDGNTSSEATEQREERADLAGGKEPHDSVLEFVEVQKRVMADGGWKDADTCAHTQTPTTELSVEEVEFGESQAGGLTDSNVVKDKISRWRQACEQTRVEADAIYKQATQRLII
ncbi:hypothetical protein AC579_3866 [Pseudocercospora musae]|uniref:Uncharacterized protein n=1 Tax=Pseudocercospora musae TaxID=113226 RepID=A0A139IRI6_9PEZI|nr:hypothetical protein AC579_3866 [Pseudocercospora musae]